MFGQLRLESAIDDDCFQMGAEGVRVELLDTGTKKAPVTGPKTKSVGSPKRSGRSRK